MANNHPTGGDDLRANPEIRNGEKSEKVCKVCGSSFGSAKALGGHMRIHSPHASGSKKLKKPYENSKSTAALKKKGKATTAMPGDESRVCKVCYKEFTSAQAVYGHMRSHSDRTWRGVNPPSTSGNHTASSSSSSASSSRSNVDHLPEINKKNDVLPSLTASLSGGWAERDIRGRKAIVDDAKIGAANSLMMLRVPSVTMISDQSPNKLAENGSASSKTLSARGEETEEPKKMGVGNNSSCEVDIANKVLDLDLNENSPSNNGRKRR